MICANVTEHHNPTSSTELYSTNMPSNIHPVSHEGGDVNTFGKHVKKLYLGKSIEELNTQAKVFY